MQIRVRIIYILSDIFKWKWAEKLMQSCWGGKSKDIHGIFGLELEIVSDCNCHPSGGSSAENHARVWEQNDWLLLLLCGWGRAKNQKTIERRKKEVPSLRRSQHKPRAHHLLSNGQLIFLFKRCMQRKDLLWLQPTHGYICACCVPYHFKGKYVCRSNIVQYLLSDQRHWV